MKRSIRLPFRLLLPSIALLLLGTAAPAQQQPQGGEETPVIEDNSFLIEEAYNQEAGVIQHINNLVHASPLSEGEYAYSFTEEWPLTGQTHQIGFTLLFLGGGPGRTDGVGDLLINYRYQLASGDLAIAPRASLIVPTGDRARGNGDGVMGFQANLPVSKRLSEAFVGHLNAGFTVLPGVEGSDAAGLAVERTLTAYTAGASLIWLTSRKLNFVLEGLLANEGFIDDAGQAGRATQFFLNPALRAAIDVGSLQIVPGFGVPILFEEGSGADASLFFYLSLEHPVGFL